MVPGDPKICSSVVGIVANPTLDDLREIMPDIAQSLQEVLDYEGNVEEDLMLTYQVSFEEYGKVHTKDLAKATESIKGVSNGGESKPVTNENRRDFVTKYLEWLLNTTVKERFRAFYLGFHSVCASNALIMLRPEEVEQLVCGCPTIDLLELRKVTYYDGGYKKDDETIIYFWQVCYNLMFAFL